MAGHRFHPRRAPFDDATVPVPRAHEAAALPIAGEPLPVLPPEAPAAFRAERETLLRRALWLGLAGAFALLVALFADNGARAAGGPRHDGFFAPTADLRAALERARAKGKHAVAVLYEMNGCGECAKLRASTLTEPALRDAYLRDFVAVALMADEPGALVDFDGAATTQSTFARRERVFALPTVVFYDLDGLPVARQIGSALPAAEWLRLGHYVRAAGYEEAPFSAWQPRLEN
jgi:thioredoxin-related protein